jgi:hypothetical protein
MFDIADEQASISTDSHLRIHSSLDPNLNDWSLSNSVYIPSLVPSGSDASADATQVSPTTTDELATGGWGLSWCKERWWGSVLAVFAGNSPVVKVSYIPPQVSDPQADYSDSHAQPFSHFLDTSHPTFLISSHIGLMGSILWTLLPPYRDRCSGWSCEDMEGRTSQ